MFQSAYSNTPATDLFERVALYAEGERDNDRPLHPSLDAEGLRKAFAIDLPQTGRAPVEVIDELIAAAEPGLVGSTRKGFLAWVIGGSHPVGVAADWLTALWGQNAGIYQTSPAAAIAEEAVEGWLLDLLDLPRQSSIGLTTGATMAGFTCLTAARGEVLRWAGHDIAQSGLWGAPKINVFVSEEAHATIFAALSYLGFGVSNFVRVPARRNGAMDAEALGTLMDEHEGPAIVIAQAGHINTGASDDLLDIALIARMHGAWLHIDGAFGLWARTAPHLLSLTDGAELAHSWSVDGHKWLQVPYDCGFAIVADRAAHRRAMDITAGYLPVDPADGRNPNQFGPELSRRARGFSVWAVMQALGRDGIAQLVASHCAATKQLAALVQAIPQARIEHDVVLNQLSVSFGSDEDEQARRDELTRAVCDSLNATGRYFLRTASWRGQIILRFSFSGAALDPAFVNELAMHIQSAIEDLCEKDSPHEMPRPAGMT